jgi:HdeA/HdeB family
MRVRLIGSIMFIAAAISGAQAQSPVPLSTYADANGYIDVQTLTCAQLANTYQQDADALTAWYSGWYNGLAHKHFADFRKGKELEHQVIVYCKANPQLRIIDAIAVVFKDERARLGIQMKPD